MKRPMLCAILAVGLLVLAGGFGLAWRHQQTARTWAAARPALPPAVGEAAPGMDARLAACAARFETWPPDAAALAEFAQVCHANGQFEPAIAAYRALMLVEPAQARWPHLLADILAGRGQLDDALPELRRATQLAPDRVIVWLKLGEALLKSNRTGEAEAAYARALERAPDDAYALLGLARCDLQADRWTAARVHLRRAVASHPDFSAAQSLLATVFDQLGNMEAAAVARARIHRDGHYPEPADSWNDELINFCHDAYTLLVAASAAVVEGRPGDALPVLQRALQLAPDDARLHRKMGNTLMQLHDVAGARVAMERAVSLAPTNDAIQLNLVAILRSANDRPALEKAVARGLSACPTSAGLNYEAGLIAQDAGRLDEAARHFDFTWKNQPDQPATALTLAKVRFRARQDELAIGVLERVLSERPDYGPAAAMLVGHGIETGDARTLGWLHRAGSSGLPPETLAELQRSYLSRFGATP